LEKKKEKDVKSPQDPSGWKIRPPQTPALLLPATDITLSITKVTNSQCLTV